MGKTTREIQFLAAKQKSKTNSTSVTKQPTASFNTNSPNNNPYTPSEIQQAMINFQGFFGLPKTRNLATLNIAKHREPRYGVNECSTTTSHVPKVIPYIISLLINFFIAL